MSDELQLFRGEDYKINDKIVIRQPTIGEICDYGEQRYYNMISTLCATPSDCKVQLLDDFGIDFEQISEFSLFCMLSRMYSLDNCSIILGDLDFKYFSIAENLQTHEMLLRDSVNNITIDNAIYTLITNHLRALHGFEKRIEVSGNEHTKKYLIDKERRRLERQKVEKHTSMLVPLISAMVNCEQFKYSHSTVWQLPIYVFMDSVRRIQALKNYDHLMQGVYTGTIDLKSISQDGLNWMGSLSKN